MTTSTPDDVFDLSEIAGVLGIPPDTQARFRAIGLTQMPAQVAYRMARVYADDDEATAAVAWADAAKAGEEAMARRLPHGTG